MIHTTESRNTPSNSMLMRRPRSAAGMANVLRYQPMERSGKLRPMALNPWLGLALRVERRLHRPVVRQIEPAPRRGRRTPRRPDRRRSPPSRRRKSSRSRGRNHGPGPRGAQRRTASWQSMSRRSRGGAWTDSAAAKPGGANSAARNRKRTIGFIGKMGRLRCCTIAPEGRAATRRSRKPPSRGKGPESPARENIEQAKRATSLGKFGTHASIRGRFPITEPRPA